MVWDPETNGTLEQRLKVIAAECAARGPQDPRDVKCRNITVTLVCLTAGCDHFTAEEFVNEYGEMGVGPWKGGLDAVEELVTKDVIRRTEHGLTMGDAIPRDVL